MALGDLVAGEEGHGGLIITGRGVVTFTDLIMDRIIAPGGTDLGRDGGDTLRIGEDLIGEVRMGEVTTMCRIRPTALILGMGTDTPIQ